jgi:hypothetical protein
VAVRQVRKKMRRASDFQRTLHAEESRSRARRKTMNEYISYWAKILFMAAVITTFLVLVNAAHCTTTKPQTNSIGIVQYNENPYIYEAVQTIAEVTEVDGNMNLRVQPVGTYLLYDDIVLLCGLPVEKFVGITEPFLMTYERVSHRMVRGVACHDLLRVDNIESNERVK